MNQLRTIAGNTVKIDVGPVVRDEIPVEIASSTATTPVEVTTKTAHGCTVGDKVRVDDHLLNGKANGEWEVEATPSATRLTLKGSSGDRVGGGTGELTRIVPVDLTLAGTKMRFMAKLRKALVDGAAEIVKDESDGVTLNSPVTLSKNRATVEIPPVDTADVLETADFYYDVELEEPGGRVTTVAQGDWQVLAAVRRA